jgi:hypothetical protein
MHLQVLRVRATFESCRIDCNKIEIDLRVGSRPECSFWRGVQHVMTCAAESRLAPHPTIFATR